MPQLELFPTSSTSVISYQTAHLVELWCANRVFASRELSDTYYTEGAIGIMH
jgi:CRISPR-associated protein Csc1